MFGPTAFVRFAAALACLVPLAGCAAASSAPQHVRIILWHHDGTDAERRVFTDQVRRYNASQSRVHVAVRTIPEGDYGDELLTASAGDMLPDVVEVDGPQLASYVYQGRLVRLDHLVPATVLSDQLPSLRAQNRQGGHTYAVSTFDSGLGLYGDRARLAQAGVRIPTGIDDAWTASEFGDVLARLARRDPDGKVLDTKKNYGTGEWLTYGFAPLVASAGGDLLDPRTLKAEGDLDGAPAVKALDAVRSWSRYIDPDPDDAAFTKRRVALSWVGHWVYPDYAKALGDDLVVLPLPDLGSGPRTGQGSWTWSVAAPQERRRAAGDFLAWLLRDDEVLRMTDANGAVPGTRTALASSRLYQADGPLRLFAEQLLRSCGDEPHKDGCVSVPRPATPGYPVLTAAFADAVAAALDGDDPAPKLRDAALVVDRDVAANDGYGSR